MEAIGHGLPEICVTVHRGADRTNLNVFPVFSLDGTPQITEKLLPVFEALYEGLPVVREWKRNHPPPGDPAGHPTQNDSVGQLDAWRRGRIRHRLVSRRTPKRREPARRVTH